MKKRLLLTNDDGYFSPGLTALVNILNEKYQVFVVAPDRERSAVSMGLTLHQPLRVNLHGDCLWSVNGTPSDCVNLAVRQLLDAPPDWVVSGMNLGENLSEDLFYSGTVAASFTAYLYGIPTLAVSLVSDRQRYDCGQYDTFSGASIAGRVLNTLIDVGQSGVIYNLNIPYHNDGQIHVTRIGQKRYLPDVEKRVDPRGREYYWMGTGSPQYEEVSGTDVWAVRNNKISLSPFTFSLNSGHHIDFLTELFHEQPH